MTASVISPKYQVVIPKDIREKAGIQPGQKVAFFFNGRQIVLIPMKPIEEGYGFLPGIDSTVEREDDRDLFPSLIPPLASDLPKRSCVKLLPKAREKFELFVTCANKWMLHDLDWERFYYFIWHCASHNVHISGQQVEDLLVDAGFTEDYAEHIALIFVHGIDIIKGPQG